MSDGGDEVLVLHDGWVVDGGAIIPVMTPWVLSVGIVEESLVEV